MTTNTTMIINFTKVMSFSCRWALPCVLLFSFSPFQPPSSRLFPYTTLFRSSAGGKKRRERALHHLITGSMSPRFPDLNSPHGKALPSLHAATGLHDQLTLDPLGLT